MDNTLNLILCGSFSPITYAHLRTFEQARDKLKAKGITVNRGIISPVNDDYGKKDLATANHRVEMIRLAIEDSDWLEVNTWEIDQPKFVLTYDALIEIKKLVDPNTQLALLCGADLLHSMTIPNVWSDEHIEGILRDFGIVVVARADCNIIALIESHPILKKYEHRIIVCDENILRSVSSTEVRNCIRNGTSAKYFTPQSVLDYIHENGLWKR